MKAIVQERLLRTYCFHWAGLFLGAWSFLLLGSVLKYRPEFGLLMPWWLLGSLVGGLFLGLAQSKSRGYAVASIATAKWALATSAAAYLAVVAIYLLGHLVGVISPLAGGWLETSAAWLFGRGVGQWGAASPMAIRIPFAGAFGACLALAQGLLATRKLPGLATTIRYAIAFATGLLAAELLYANGQYQSVLGALAFAFVAASFMTASGGKRSDGSSVDRPRPNIGLEQSG